VRTTVHLWYIINLVHLPPACPIHTLATVNGGGVVHGALDSGRCGNTSLPRRPGAAARMSRTQSLMHDALAKRPRSQFHSVHVLGHGLFQPRQAFDKSLDTSKSCYSSHYHIFTPFARDNWCPAGCCHPLSSGAVATPCFDLASHFALHQHLYHYLLQLVIVRCDHVPIGTKLDDM